MLPKSKETSQPSDLCRPRRRVRFVWPLVAAALALVPRPAAADSTVVFNEIMYHPAGGETELEWIELHNQMAVDMDISDWYVTGGVAFTVPEGTVLEGGGYLVIAASPQALAQATGYAGAYGPFTGDLEDLGERLELRNNSDRLMDAVDYKDRDAWPVEPGGSGATLAKFDADTASGRARNWTFSPRVGGTPGAPNFLRADDPGDQTEGLVSYWNFDDPVFGSGEYFEDFDEPNGSPQDWVPYDGDVSIHNGRLRVTSAQGSEPFAWAGVSGTPIYFNTITSISFRVEYVGDPGDTVGRHGGVVVCCSEPTNRYSAGMSGYMIDWIDRTSDHGYRIIKMTDGTHSGIGSMNPGPNPGTEWRIEFTAASFTLTVDDQLIGTFDDSSYRNGYVAAWCYTNGGQDIRFDDVRIAYTGSVLDSADGNHGETGSHATQAEGIVGSGAVSFDNTAEAFVDVGSGTGNNFAVSSGLSIEAIITPGWSGGLLEYDTIFRKEDGQNRMLLALQHDDQAGTRDVPLSPALQRVLAFGINVGGTYSELDMPLDGAGGRPTLAELKDGNPHHVVATYDVASGIKAIYLDGAECFSVQMTAGSPITSGGSAPAHIGNAATGADPFTGVVDEVAFWSRALPAEEVARHFANVQDGKDYFVPVLQEEEPRARVVFNEFVLALVGDSWIELLNEGDLAFVLTGCVLTTDRAPASQYVFPAGTLGPGGYLALTETELGFDLALHDRVFLYGPGATEVVAAMVITDQHRGRAPRWSGRWLYPDEPTPGEANSFALLEDLVISEIMYHPMVRVDPEERGEYIELFNRGDRALDLGDVRFVHAIFYTFPEGTILRPGDYIVVARDPEWLAKTYDMVTPTGPFAGQLANGGERIELVNARGNTIDEVHYYDGGRWPAYADGGGSSLELRDPWADNAKPEAWAASDETGKVSWRTYSYRAVAANDRGPTQWNEFVMGLLNDGEVLLDDLSVVESPGGAGIQFLENRTFETGTAYWRLIGNHSHSHVITDPDDPGNTVLRLIATGPTEHMHNHAETTFAGGQKVVNGRQYEISYRAKWIGGSNLLHTTVLQPRGPGHGTGGSRGAGNPRRPELRCRGQPGADVRGLPAPPRRSGSGRGGHGVRCRR